MKNVLAIVVTYNRKDLLVEAIDSLLKQSYESMDIMVVDNASTDGTKEQIQQYIEEEQIKYINTGANIGGAGGFNAGVKLGAQQSYKYLWVMDDDTIPDTTALEELINAANVCADEFGFLCSDVRWIDNTPCLMNKPTISNNWHDSLNKLEYGIMSMASCSFVSCFFKTEDVYKIGLPIKEFFIWGDDVEYTRRLTKEKPSYLVYKSKVLHKMAANKSTDIANESPDRLFRYKYSYRNHFYNNKSQNKTARLTFAYELLLDTKNILKSKQSGKCKKLSIMYKSYIAGFSFNPSIEFPENNTENEK